MPLIITATDFSAVAENATNYACQLAMAHNARLVIVHSFVFPVIFSDVPMPASLISDTQSDAEDQINDIVARYKESYPALDVEGLVLDGDIINSLEEYAEDNEDPWLVVLGNSTAGDQPTWIDSNVIAAFKHLRYPVLAVPAEATYNPVKKMCLAFDNKHTGNATALAQLTDIASQMGTDLQVLNMQPDVLNRDNTTEIDAEAVKILAPANPHFHVLYEVRNIDDTVQDFVQKNNIDWLILIPRKHSFFEGLFHKSQTKAIAHHSHIPVLALHETHIG